MAATDFRRFLDAYLAPPGEYAPVPFWFLNDAPDKDALERQLQAFYDKGIRCVVAHPRIGIPWDVPYLGDAFMSMIAVVIQKAQKLNMTVILYDEGMYPSGSAGGQVAQCDPRFAARCVYPLYEACPLNALEECLLEASVGGKPARIIHGPSYGTIRGIHFGQDSREAKAPPAGDILNPEAVRCFIRLTHERYKEWFGASFGKTVTGFFTDEPSPMGRYPRADAFAWTYGMEEEFPPDELAQLWETGGAGEQARAKHRRAVTLRVSRVFFGAIQAWCRGNGLLLMGHPGQPDETAAQRMLDIPGQDLIMRTIAPERDPLDTRDGVMAKLTADLARAMGKKRNLNEALGVCHRSENEWHLPFEDVKWMLDHLLSRGCNLLVLHAFYYSLRGRRRDERPPDVGMNSPWWNGYDDFARYLSRLCWLNTGELQAKIAVLCADGAVPSALVRPLYEQQVDFVYLDEADFLARECAFDLILAQAPENMHAETREKLRGYQTASRYPLDKQPSGLRVQRLRMHGIDYMTAFNEGTRRERLDAAGYTQVWFPLEDRRWRIGGMPVELDAGQTAVLVNAPEEALPVYGDGLQALALPLTGPWSVTVEGKTAQLDAADVPGFRFSGETAACADYQTVFTLPEPYAAVSLAVGTECAEVFIDGLRAGFCLAPSAAVPFPDALSAGPHSLLVRLYATAANLYGGAAIPCGLAALPKLLCYPAHNNGGDTL